MTLCRVKGTVVSTVKHPTYKGLKLYVVQPVDENGKPVDSSFLAVDQVQSGVGDLVLVVTEGNSARQIFKQKILPIRSVIVGVVDAVDYHASTVLEAR
ncbi:MAG: EutN/CcmL family microcompartment protein [Myxococcota bacterium]|jgi:ethanolamine utilization protein EutN|nr:EutN/CcmL family microcompartment protein [Myxococcota bacterium]HHW96825.1 EutN/CcmL family microcompartment protein [Oligoflexales bacterium]MBP8970341.1 EutN/CcmL family microcompartment protein [Myxococcota bacterium]HOE81346.1 EutN/CcmL family microcompartment protein [Myxococcota bacterium]HON24842.1 EutN/CcmL family microcompartment protein [Myxococcota bacterium]